MWVVLIIIIIIITTTMFIVLSSCVDNKMLSYRRETALQGAL